MANITATIRGFADTITKFKRIKDEAEDVDNAKASPWIDLKGYEGVKDKFQETFANMRKVNYTKSTVNLAVDGFKTVSSVLGKVIKEKNTISAKQAVVGLGVAGSLLTLKKLMTVRKQAMALGKMKPTPKVDADTAGAHTKLSLIERQVNRLDGSSINLDLDVVGATLLPRILGDSIASLMEFQSVLAIIHAIKIPAFIGAIGGAGTALLSLASAAAALAAGLAQGLAGAFGAATAAAGQFGAGLGLVGVALGATISQMSAHKTASNALATAQSGVETALGQVQTAQDAKRASEEAMTMATHESELATEALNMALATEQLRLRQMNNDIEGMQLSQKQMALDLKEAEKDLAKARQSGTQAEVAAAELRVLEIRNQMEGNAISMKFAEKDLQQARKRGTTELQSAADGWASAQQAQEDAAQQNKDATAQLATAMEDLAVAQEEEAQAAAAWGATLTKTQQQVMAKLGQLKTRFQDTFSSAMGNADRLIIKVLDLASEGLPFLGRAANDNVLAISRAFDSVEKKIKMPRQLKLFERFFRDLPKITERGAEAFGNFGLAAFNAFVPGLKYGRQLVTVINRASEAALRWTRSSEGQNKLADIWAHMVKRAKQLAQAAWNSARGIAHMMDAIGETGMTNRMMKGLVNITDQFGDMTAEGTKSRKAIDKFLSATQPLVNEVWRIVKRLVSEFLEVSNAIALAGGKNKKLNPLLSIFRNIRRAIGPIGELIEENMIKLGPKLGPLIFNLAKIARVFLATVPPLELLIDAMNKVMHWFTRLDPQLQRIIASSASWALALSSLGLGLGFIGGKMAKVGKVFGKILGPFGKVFKFVAKMGTKFRGLLMLFGRLVVFIPGLGVALGLVTGPIGWIALAIGALVIAGAALIANWKKIKKAFTGGDGPGMFKKMGDAIKEFGRWIKVTFIKVARAAVSWFNKHWPDIKKAVINAAEEIDKVAKPVYTKIFKSIVGAAKSLVKWIKKNWPDIKEGIVGTLKAIWRAAKPVLKALFGFIMKQAKWIVKWVDRNWPLISKTFKTVFNAAWGAVKTFVKDIKKAWKALKSDNNETWNLIKGIIVRTWRVIKSVVGLAIRTVFRIIKATMHVINGDWGKAWKEIQKILFDVMRTIRKIVGEVLGAIWDIFKFILNKIWDVVKWAFNKIVDFVKNKIDEKRKKIEDFFSWLGNAWKKFYDKLPKPVQQAFDKVKSIMVNVLEAGVNKTRDILASLMSAIGSVLGAIGMDDLSGDAKSVADDLRKPIKMARGGVIHEGENRGGYADGKTPHAVYGEAGEEIYARTDKRTPESARALDYANRKWAQRGWFRNEHQGAGMDDAPRMAVGGALKAFRAQGVKFFRPGGFGGGTVGGGGGDSQGGRGNGAGFETKAGSSSNSGGYGQLVGRIHDGGSGSGQYGPTANHLWEDDTFGRVIEVLKKFRVSANTYENHPPGYPGLAGKSADFWDYKGRGTPIPMSLNNSVSSFIQSKLKTGLSWMLNEGDAGHSGGTRHVHATWKGSDPNTPNVKYTGGTGGGSGGFDWMTPITEAIKKITEIVGKLGGTKMGIISKGMGEWGSSLPGKIKDWLVEMAKEKWGSIGDALGFGGDSPSGLTIGEALEQGGWPGNQLVQASSTVWHESGGNAKAQNPSGARGLMQIMPITARDVGANYSKLYDPVYNTSVGKKVFDKAGGWGPWVGAGQGGDYRNKKVTGYGLGGVVPGVMDRAQTIIAHAGERVLPRQVNRAFEQFAHSIDRQVKQNNRDRDRGRSRRQQHHRGNSKVEIHVHNNFQGANVGDMDDLLDKLDKKTERAVKKAFRDVERKGNHNISIVTNEVYT